VLEWRRVAFPTGMVLWKPYEIKVLASETRS
jgi:hypothetical protein